MIVIVDYGMGNLRSVQYKLKKTGIDALVSSSPDDIERANALILPGVGHFAKGMENIHKAGLFVALNDAAMIRKIPVMGICLGMQLFARKSQEGSVAGLGWIDGEVSRFQFEGQNHSLRVPHVGWNTITPEKESPLLTSVEPRQRFYFTHSYYMECKNEDDILATTHYGYPFVSVVHRDNIFGTQFHPEKSHRRGIGLIVEFLRNLPC